MTKDVRAWALTPILVAVSLMAFSAAWLAVDRAPLVYDPSSHLFSALYFANLPGDYLTLDEPVYPPVVHVTFGTLLSITDYRVDTSLLITNSIFVALLIGSTYKIGEHLSSARAGAFAVVLLALYPAVFIHARSLMLDLPLAAMVAAAMLALLKSDGFRNTAWSVTFGIVCAVGILTKQAFFFAIALPLAWELWHADKKIAAARNIATASVIVLIVFSAWYVPRLGWFLGDYRDIQEAYGAGRGDPPTLSLHGLTYYLVGTWHQTSLAFAVVWIATLPLFVRTQQRGLLVSWWIGVVAFSSLLVLKDSRFLIPALPAIALMTAIGLDRLQNATLVTAVLATFGAVQLWGASFGIAALPEGDVVFNRVERDEDYSWFAQHYRLALGDSSIADPSGWGGAGSELSGIDGRVGILANKIIFEAAQGDHLARKLAPGERASSFRRLTCADAASFGDYDVIVAQFGGVEGVAPADTLTCTAQLREMQRIPIRVPRLLPGITELVVFQPLAASRTEGPSRREP